MHADALSDHSVRGASVYTLADRPRTRRPRRWRSARTAPTGSPAPAINAPPEVARILASLVRRETRIGSGRLARSMVGSLDQDLPMLPNPERHAGFVVLKAADIPSVLVEMGFMSNPPDEAELRRPQHRARVAEAMKRAVDAYFVAAARVASGRSREMDVWIAFSLLVGRVENSTISPTMSEPLTAGEPLAPPPRTIARAARRQPPPPRRPRRGLFRRFVRGVMGGCSAIVLLVAVVGGVGGYFACQRFSADLPDVDGLRNYQPPVMSRVYAGDARLMAELATERRIFVPYSAIPDMVKQAFVSAEDQNFWTHRGVDPLAIVRAAMFDLTHMGQGDGRSAPPRSPSRSPRTCCWTTRYRSPARRARRSWRCASSRTCRSSASSSSI